MASSGNILSPLPTIRSIKGSKPSNKMISSSVRISRPRSLPKLHPLRKMRSESEIARRMSMYPAIPKKAAAKDWKSADRPWPTTAYKLPLAKFELRQVHEEMQGYRREHEERMQDLGRRRRELAKGSKELRDSVRRYDTRFTWLRGLAGNAKERAEFHHSRNADRDVYIAELRWTILQLKDKQVLLKKRCDRYAKWKDFIHTFVDNNKDKFSNFGTMLDRFHCMQDHNEKLTREVKRKKAKLVFATAEYKHTHERSITKTQKLGSKAQELSHKLKEAEGRTMEACHDWKRTLQAAAFRSIEGGNILLAIHNMYVKAMLQLQGVKTTNDVFERLEIIWILFEETRDILQSLKIAKEEEDAKSIPVASHKSAVTFQDISLASPSESKTTKDISLASSAMSKTTKDISVACPAVSKTKAC